MTTGFGFPFQVAPTGAITPVGDEDDDLRGKIIQVLFTAPGLQQEPSIDASIPNFWLPKT